MHIQHILRGFLVLLVLRDWAMREPFVAGRVACTDSHAFFVLIGHT